MESTQTEAGPCRWAVIILWMVCHSTAWATVFAIGILLPSISAEFQLSYLQQGLLSSAPVWANVALTIPFSVWVTRYSPTTLTTVTLALGVLGIILQASSVWFVFLLVSRLAFGITMAAREPARAMLTQQWFTAGEFMRANGITAGILSFVFAGLILATPQLLDASSNDWRTTMYLISGFSALLTILWAILGRDRVKVNQLRPTRRMANPLGPVLRHKELWMAGLGMLGASMTFSSFFAFYPTLMLDRFHFALGYSGAILAVVYLAGGVTSMVIGRIATNWRSRPRFLYLFGVLMVGTSIGLVVTDSLPLLFSIAVLNGIAWGFFPILLTVAFHLPGIRIQEIPVAYAVLLTVVSLGMAVGPPLAGLLQEGLENMVMVFVVMSLLSLSVTTSGIFLRGLEENKVSTM